MTEQEDKTFRQRWLERRDATCTKCRQTKRPTRGYVALLKARNLPYVCKACRASQPPVPMDLGKLGCL
jgi:hypothetical protein